jgi:hypothetical protein
MLAISSNFNHNHSHLVEKSLQLFFNILSSARTSNRNSFRCPESEPVVSIGLSQTSTTLFCAVWYLCLADFLFFLPSAQWFMGSDYPTDWFNEFQQQIFDETRILSISRCITWFQDESLDQDKSVDFRMDVISWLLQDESKVIDLRIRGENNRILRRGWAEATAHIDCFIVTWIRGNKLPMESCI